MNKTDENNKLKTLNDDTLENVTGGVGGPLLGNFINVLGGSNDIKSENTLSGKNSVSSCDVPKNIV